MPDGYSQLICTNHICNSIRSITPRSTNNLYLLQGCKGVYCVNILGKFVGGSVSSTATSTSLGVVYSNTELSSTDGLKLGYLGLN